MHKDEKYETYKNANFVKQSFLCQNRFIIILSFNALERSRFIIWVFDFSGRNAGLKMITKNDYRLVGVYGTYCGTPLNTTTVRPKNFGRIKGVVVLTEVGIKLQNRCFLMTSCQRNHPKNINIE